VKIISGQSFNWQHEKESKWHQNKKRNNGSAGILSVMFPASIFSAKIFISNEKKQQQQQYAANV
jgi:hypothetical protein